MRQAKRVYHDPFKRGQIRKGLQISFDYICVDCGNKFTANSGLAARCKECNVIHKKAYMKKYHEGRKR